MNRKLKSTSKFTSYVLRHKPETIGLELDSEGWAKIDQMIRLANGHGTKLTRELLLEVVATSDKKRFALSQDGSRIRANQGHSIQVNLNLQPQIPPQILSVDTHFWQAAPAVGRSAILKKPETSWLLEYWWR